MRWTVFLSLVLFGATPLFAGEGCSYLTNEEVERVTGRELLFKLSSMPLPNGAGTLCDSNIVRVMVLQGQDPAQAFAKMLKDAGREDEERFPVADLGASAYALHLKPRSENELPTALVVVPTDAFIAAISVRARDGEAAESAQPEAVELAKIVLSKL